MSFRPSPLVRLRGLHAAERQFAVALPEAERMAGLNRQFAGVVPTAVARACSVAAIQGETAIIFCGNGAAASRVRAQAKGVARALSRPDAPVTGVRVKVWADWALPDQPEKCRPLKAISGSTCSSLCLPQAPETSLFPAV